jgi:hypothetical protein
VCSGRFFPQNTAAFLVLLLAYFATNEALLEDLLGRVSAGFRVNVTLAVGSNPHNGPDDPR